MTPAAQIASLIDLVEQATRFTQPADQLFNIYMRRRRYIGSKDRRQLGTWLYEILRSYAKLSAHAHDPLTLVLAYFKLSLKWKTKEISTHFTGKAYAPQRLSAELQEWLDELTFDSLPEHLEYECPKWLWSQLSDKKEVLMALQTEAPCDIRANSLITTREQLQQKLQKQSIKTTLLESPDALRVEGRHQLMQIELFKKGHFEIQDQGSQDIIQLCQASPGDLVIDLCAGGGGKALGMAATMQNKGRLIACDIITQKLKNTQIRMKRAGITIGKIQQLDARGRKRLNIYHSKADLVLVDAPCSGTGTWRRNPDLRWRLQPKELKKLLSVQSQLLDQAAELVKPGGLLVYATCSILPSENEQQISSFLKRRVAFTPQDKLHLYPPHSDGFFAQALIKRK